jgi:hypothetical protein
VADWHWEPVTDDLFDGLPPAALKAIRQLARELTVLESMVFLDGRTLPVIRPDCGLYSAAHLCSFT